MVDERLVNTDVRILESSAKEAFSIIIFLSHSACIINARFVILFEDANDTLTKTFPPTFFTFIIVYRLWKTLHSKKSGFRQ